MTTRLSARRNAADNRHPIHLAAHRLAEIRARSLQTLLVVAATLFAATLFCIVVLVARR
ncbi:MULTISPECIES: hypothetical protein [unclassified Xanthobacter]|uniref:hypothetical protein n=1 Tax=unclassified Xanthobacter TaxID=2623496 RepID=UPI001EDF4277|nr:MULTISPECIES: hypothetical protein [unclassified Xanthobacter]